MHGCVVARDPAGVRILICAAQDQDASRYFTNKAVVQHEMLGWHMGHGDLPLPGALGALTELQKMVGALSGENTSESTLLPPMMSSTSLMHGPKERTASSNIPEAIPQGRSPAPGLQSPATTICATPQACCLAGDPGPPATVSSLKTNVDYGPCLKGPALRAHRVAELSSQHLRSFSSQ